MLASFGGATNVFADDAQPKFLGSQSCSTSGCHGGAGEISRQFTVWSQRDFHHQRPVATLTTARSERIADVLKIKDPTTSDRCTACHAPVQTIPAGRKTADFKIEEGVSCENCHGPAEKWIRSHTRTDYTHEMRVASGMRDLKNLYVRANTCVACHQNIDSDLRAAGHPELIFELDGQAVTQPKHWREKTNWHGAQAWLVGQAVALRETSWQLAEEKSPNENEINRWKGLTWLVYRASEAETSLPKPPDTNFRPSSENFEKAQKWSDELAKAAAKISWTEDLTRKVLAALANPSNGVTDPVGQPIQARRAERLVLGLDRLVADLGWTKNEKISPALDKLFKGAQSLPDFNADQFGKDLKDFHASVSAILDSK